MKTKTTQVATVKMFLLENKEICPAFVANSYIIVKGKRLWLGSSVDSLCRGLSLQGYLTRDWIQKYDRHGVLRHYRTFSLKKKYKKLFTKNTK